MSEVMAIETIVEEYAKFKGYITETRVSLKTKKGGHPDIDIFGYNPKNKRLLMIECKAWGKADDYVSFDTPSRIKRINGVFNDMARRWKDFKDFKKSKLADRKRWSFRDLNELWLVIPGYFEKEESEHIQEQIKSKIKKKIKSIIDVKIIPIHEIILGIIKDVNKEKGERGRRYSNPALEFCRWLLRGYENNRLNLTDLGLELKGEKVTYELLKRNYLSECLRWVQKNVDIRKDFKFTRKNTLILLNAMKKKATLGELELTARKLYSNLNLNRSRIRVGLATWQNLGIVSKDKESYYINDSFKNIYWR